MPTPDALQVHRALIRVEEVEREILQILYVPQRMRIEQQLRLRRIPGRLWRPRKKPALRKIGGFFVLNMPSAPVAGASADNMPVVSRFCPRASAHNYAVAYRDRR
jgi:hypothetical protein